MYHLVMKNALDFVIAEVVDDISGLSHPLHSALSSCSCLPPQQSIGRKGGGHRTRSLPGSTCCCGSWALIRAPV